jgi:hypothetical protein
MEEHEPISMPPPFVDEEPEPVISFESEASSAKQMNPYEAYLMSSSVDTYQNKANLDRVFSSDGEPEPCVSMTYSQNSETDLRPTYSAEQYMKLAYSVSLDPSVDFEELEQRNNAKQLAMATPDPALLAASLKAVASINKPTASPVVTETSDNPWLLDPMPPDERPTQPVARFDHSKEFSAAQPPADAKQDIQQSKIAVQPQQQLGAKPPPADQPRELQKAPTEDHIVRALSDAASHVLASASSAEIVNARQRGTKKPGYTPPQISTDPSQSYTTSYEGGDSMSPESRRVANSYTSDSQTQSSPSRRGTQSYTSASESHDSEPSRSGLNVKHALSERTRSRMADVTSLGNMNPYDPSECV